MDDKLLNKIKEYSIDVIEDSEGNYSIDDLRKLVVDSAIWMYNELNKKSEEHKVAIIVYKDNIGDLAARIQYITSIEHEEYLKKQDWFIDLRYI